MRGDEDACGEVGHEESNGYGDPIHAAMMEAQVCIEGHAGDPAELGSIRARLRNMVRRLKQKADSICLTADGVVPLDLACPSSREALLGLLAGAPRTAAAACASHSWLLRSLCLGRCLGLLFSGGHRCGDRSGQKYLQTD